MLVGLSVCKMDCKIGSNGRNASKFLRVSEMAKLFGDFFPNHCIIDKVASALLEFPVVLFHCAIDQSNCKTHKAKVNDLL